MVAGSVEKNNSFRLKNMLKVNQIANQIQNTSIQSNGGAKGTKIPKKTKIYSKISSQHLTSG